MQQTLPPSDADPAARRGWFADHIPLVSGGAAILLAILLGLLIVVREQAALLGLDEEWAEEMVEIRGPLGEWLAMLFDTIGGHLLGTFLIPIAIFTVLLLVRRPWAASYYLVATITSALLVQLLKQVFARARPEDMLVTSDFGSFPSGHVANAATMATTLSVIFPFVWVWLAGAVYTVLMAISRTYLGVHWLTDTIGGMLVGVGVALVLWGPFAAKIEEERLRKRSTTL